ncbi:MAG TPA: hypothetical protein VGM44_00205, partial [Polyangiaceae bacterium]
MLGCAAACSSSSTKQSTSSASNSTPPVPFEAVSPASYVAKVKNVLVGMPPTDDEISAVSADPSALKGLITNWQELPEYQSKMQRFFELAFQQTQISIADFADQSYPKQLVINQTTSPLLLQAASQSFARTMRELISEGRPLTDAVTTQQLMMTTALKELYAFLDVWEVDDDGKVTDGFKAKFPKQSIIAESALGPIPIADSVDPTNANFMHFYDPDVATANTDVSDCASDPITFPSSAMSVHRILYGSLDGYKSATSVACPPVSGGASSAQLTSDDFNDWTMVSLRAPNAGEAVTAFYDLPGLRSASELVLTVPRLGFFSTPAFFANWQTNISNQMRVTLNQSLIVALGAQVDGTDTTMTPGNPPPGLDAMHAGSGACFGCHQSLDPLRSIFSATYSWNYHNQLDGTWSTQPGIFSFQKVTQSVKSMADFGAVLGSHPLFAKAWVQKLCYYANSSPCLDSDPEFQRVVSVFQSSNFAWNTLVAELLSSPLITNAAHTATYDKNGEVVAVSRRDHLCAALDTRLGFADICGSHAVTSKEARALVPSIAAGLPSDGYGRGSVAPVLPNQPTLFYRAGLENICENVASQTVDVATANQQANVKQWSSKDPNSAIADFVSIVMALAPSDPRSSQATSILQSHFMQATQGGATASNAL